MIPAYRKKFNAGFSHEKYALFLSELQGDFPPIPFRVAETPVFVPHSLKQQLIEAGDEIIDLIKQKTFKELTQRSIPTEWHVSGDEKHPHFLTFDFGICEVDGALRPMLIEMQGFPSLYGFQTMLGRQYKQVFGIDHSVDYFLNGYTEETYFELLKRVIVGEHKPHEVILMDVDAPNQKTAIDFYVTAKHLGIKILAFEELIQKGRELFYTEQDKEIRIKRIYNRLIFDELGAASEAFKGRVDLRQDLDVEWITHPNWFYRISKYTLPLLNSKYVPETTFADQLKRIPADLENYVLKPLFSFAGMGVIIDVTKEDITSLEDPENWILQRKVSYAPVVQAPDGGVKVEIRMMYLWEEGKEPQLCINLSRLSRGKMIGVRYNKDFDWVGGTICFMEK